MSRPAIVVENLGKLYRLGALQRRHDTFRDLVADIMTAPLRRIRAARTPASDREDAFWALRDVSFEVSQGEVVGIIGRNGAGKSTLLKILSRITEPTTGRARMHGRVASLLEVGTGFHPELSGRENVYLNGAILGMRKAEIRRKFDEIVAFAEVEKFLDTPVKRYSSGMYVRLAFAVAAHLDPEILIVDEVLAVGDTEFQSKCLGKMQEVSRGEGRTVLFVSHNMTAVLRLCSRGVLLNGGSVQAIGAAAEVIDVYTSKLPKGLSASRQAAPHVLYDADPTARTEFEVFRIEALDPNGRPLDVVCSGEDVAFRIWYRSGRAVRKAAVELKMITPQGVRLLFLSTEPDGTMPLQFEPGIGSVECVIRGLPLAAGEYVIGAALAVPQIEYLWQQDELATVRVHPRDVYGSGLPPMASRCLLVATHEWRRVPPSDVMAGTPQA